MCALFPTQLGTGSDRGALYEGIGNRVKRFGVRSCRVCVGDRKKIGLNLHQKKTKE